MGMVTTRLTAAVLVVLIVIYRIGKVDRMKCEHEPEIFVWLYNVTRGFEKPKHIALFHSSPLVQ